MNIKQIVNCYVKYTVKSDSGFYATIYRKIGKDAEFTGRIKYVKDDLDNVNIYVEIEYEDKKVEKLKRRRQPKTFSERLHAFLFNHAFEEEYEKRTIKKCNKWIEESDVKIEVVTIVDCDNNSRNLQAEVDSIQK